MTSGSERSDKAGSVCVGGGGGAPGPLLPLPAGLGPRGAGPGGALGRGDPTKCGASSARGDSEAAPGLRAALPEQGEERQRREGARDTTREEGKGRGKKKEKQEK